MNHATSLLLIAAIAASGIGFAQTQSKGGKAHSHSGKTHKAHDHSAAELNIAVEGNGAVLEMHAPATPIVGFEHVPSSAADKKKQADALAKLKASIGQMVIFDPAAGCKITPKSVEVHQEEEDHAEVDADFAVSCAKPLAGTKVSFGLTKVYAGLTNVKVQAVGASGSTGADIKSDKGVVTLPR
jgi:hypothetical protein